MTPRDKLIIPLDVSDLATAIRLIRELSPYAGWFKIGLQAITAIGTPTLVEIIHAFGAKVFLDGKWDDIPNTVGEAAAAAAGLGVEMFNVHASAWMPAMSMAVHNKGAAKVYAVTVLTSLSDDDSRYIFGASAADKVIQFAHAATAVNMDGIICSPKELVALRDAAQQPNGEQITVLEKVTPGVRPVWSSMNDQARVMTPGEAIAAGATMLVVGRPITKPPAEIGTPADAAQRVLEEIATAMEGIGL